MTESGEGHDKTMTENGHKPFDKAGIDDSGEGGFIDRPNRPGHMKRRMKRCSDRQPVLAVISDMHKSCTMQLTEKSGEKTEVKGNQQ